MAVVGQHFTFLLNVHQTVSSLRMERARASNLGVLPIHRPPTTRPQRVPGVPHGQVGWGTDFRDAPVTAEDLERLLQGAKAS